MAKAKPKFSLSSSFFPCVLKLQANEGKRVLEAVEKFAANTATPSLNLHPVKSDQRGRLYTFRASDDLRVLAVRLGENTWILEEVGHHDELYRRAESGVFLADPSGEQIGFFTAEDAGSREGIPTRAAGTSRGRVASPALLPHWTDRELIEAGLLESTVKLIRSVDSIDDFLNLDLGEDQSWLAIEFFDTTPEAFRARTTAAAEKESTGKIETQPDPEQVLTQYGGAFGFSPFMTAEELKKLLSAPIERWMIFLHPAQEEVVRREFSGPARVGGPAGTGKTVVGLHRAVELAHRFRDEGPAPQILFTTFIRSLPPYFEHLYNQIPRSIPGAVRFVNVDSLAAEVCRRLGEPVRPDQAAADELFTEAYQSVVTPGSALAKSFISEGYVRDEVDAVIRGRMIGAVDEYLVLERTGRKTPLQANARRQVWKIHEKFASLKRRHGVNDFIDVVSTAVRLTNRKKPQYRAAIIDEAQDLSLMALRLIRNLATNPKSAPRRDELMLIGDGAQRVYPSCFTLAQAGLTVRGRSVTLTTNYRNTKEILRAAFAVAGDRQVNDLDSIKSTKSRVDSSLPPGEKPSLVLCESSEGRTRYIAERIRDLVESGGFGYGDIGILAPRNNLANGLGYGLGQLGVPTVLMRDVATPSGSLVRVGTFHRAKGLEFKAVFVVGLETYPTKPRKSDSVSTAEDRLELELNVLFVAMTRAREVLDLVSVGEPTEAVLRAKTHLRKIKFSD